MEFTIKKTGDGWISVLGPDGYYVAHAELVDDPFMTVGRALNRMCDANEGDDEAILRNFAMAADGAAGRLAIQIMAADTLPTPQGMTHDQHITELLGYYPEPDVSRDTLRKVTEARIRQLDI